ncbi:hypothetical protein SAMD00079811_18230 [Scytonema sp. HK-05]|uniref:hypothetical protein n=1 Tax=unclassified Scytonema TaxID=2618749 RepID=UPI00093703C4|nr:hypothetical protein [Scytonema sp. HK-05]OKH44178.1 hypothetical protein NIES2130_38165 [Scytonema sp. HK-05]BAY44227.1 hypothetical protein SAMD00079811_18230 [Scytonema sp. HK-05]
MLVSSFIALGFAIALSQVSAKIANQIWQFLAILIALFCLGLSFIFSPVPIEVLIVIALLITTRQIHTLNHNN